MRMPSGPIAPTTRGPAARGPVGQLAGDAIDLLGPLIQPEAESFTGLAPKVLVSRISAPART